MKTISSKSLIAVQEYQSGQFSNQALAVRYGVSLSTIYHWIRRSGIPRRPPGRRPLEQPTPKHHQMIELSAQLPCSEIAHQFGVSRQCVHQVLTRWAHLRPQRPVPAKPAAVLKPQTLRDLKEHIITFRLTAPQTDQVRATLKSCGIGNRLSDGAACRAVLLAALGLGKFQLANSGVSKDHAGNNGRDLGIGPSTEAGSIGLKMFTEATTTEQPAFQVFPATAYSRQESDTGALTGPETEL